MLSGASDGGERAADGVPAWTGGPLDRHGHHSTGNTPSSIASYSGIFHRQKCWYLMKVMYLI